MSDRPTGLEALVLRSYILRAVSEIIIFPITYVKVKKSGHIDVKAL
jgi:hypothetical protein